MRNWFRKFVIKTQFCLVHRQRVRNVFTWHDRLFILTGSNILYEVFEDYRGDCNITLRCYLDPNIDLEVYMRYS